MEENFGKMGENMEELEDEAKLQSLWTNFSTENFSKNGSDYEEELYTYDTLRYSLHFTILLSLAYLIVLIFGILGNTAVCVIVIRSPRMRNSTNYFILNLALADLLVCLLCIPFTAIGNVFSVIYLAVFILGILGNTMVAIIIIRTRKNATDYFLLNLVIADLLVLIFCLPFTLIFNIINSWILGEWICKIVPYLQGVSVSASIDTLIAIAMERYLAICHPMTFQISGGVCRLIIIIIWVFSFSITLPWAIFFQLTPLNSTNSIVVCTEIWPDSLAENIYFLIAHLILCYILPLILITVFYALILRRVSMRKIPQESKNLSTEILLQRSKMKVIKMLLVVVILFALSWLPLYAIFTRIKFGPPISSVEDKIIRTITPMAQWLGSSNSSINPILYSIYNKKYRSGFKSLLSKTCCSLRVDVTKSNSTSRSSNRINLSNLSNQTHGSGISKRNP